jgi:outer membrane lipoprotein-sorting protein
MLGMEDPSGLDNSVMVFKEPASVKNTRFLMKENDGRNDDQWIYLPALKKVKRIASGEKDNAFMGSDFSYGDMESRDADEDNHSLLREESLNGESVWVVESIPLPGHEIGYSRVISWVSKDSHMPLKVEFYNDKSDALEKTMINEDIRMVDGQWTIYKVTMTDASSGHKTVMSINKVRYNIPVKPGYFTTNYLQTGRAQ